MPSSSSPSPGPTRTRWTACATTSPACARDGTSQQIRDIVTETLHEIIDPIVYDEAVELIEEHKAEAATWSSSRSSGQEVVEPIGEMVGADDCIATRWSIEDGKYTGEIEFYAYGPHKAEAIRTLAAERGYDLGECYAYSDSITDLPMLRGGRAPVRGQPRPGAAQGGARARLAGSGVLQRRSATGTAVGSSTTASWPHGRHRRRRDSGGGGGLDGEQTTPFLIVSERVRKPAGERESRNDCRETLALSANGV